MRKNSSLIKILYFIPFLTPAVPAAILWKWLYNQSYGLINAFLSMVTTLNVHIGWLTNPNLVIFSIAVVFLWKNIGWAMLIYIAGLQNLPKALFEEASLHGASVWVKIKDIMLPSLSPVILAVVFVQIINSLQVFTEVYIMTDGGPVGSSEMVATYIYKKAFLYMDIGYACAMALVFLSILISITVARMNLSAKRG
jgi:multiple sugar transport system permease protein